MTNILVIVKFAEELVIKINCEAKTSNAIAKKNIKSRNQCP
jgi:hypothetical protein